MYLLVFLFYTFIFRVRLQHLSLSVECFGVYTQVYPPKRIIAATPARVHAGPGGGLVVKCTLRRARVWMYALCSYGSFTKSVLGFYVHARYSYITDGAHIT